ncbi:glycosyltransferase family 2 protein [Streptomyces spirodelae]|uniref:Glycosyltransferase n=1 Tax=Streptomyces spirodelae TaxID=2812904 RepID=A0ABS3WPD5_9ACTN|nr:glycosyltransferase [Streptomyces spirodelae]MBO8184982.1 glycosyltransferase [Streptomyces spirodelae]
MTEAHEHPTEAATRDQADGSRAGHGPDPRVTVVVITRDRKDELLRTLDLLADLPEQPPVIVVDNASTDGTADAVRAAHPQVKLLRPGRNTGAVGRNLAVRQVTTPYVAFCDDDSWWEPGSLRAAADRLDAHPRLAGVVARIVVEPQGTEDPVVAELRDSPVDGPDWLPGPALGSFLAAATCLRVSAFRAAGGFEPRLWLGGEEELLATDLAVQGWWLAFAEELTVHHAPSRVRDATARRTDGLRNTLWYTWLRRPLPAALRRTWHLARTVPRDAASVRAFTRAAAALPWVLAHRRPVPPPVEARLATLERAQRGSTARQYVG